MMSIEQDLQLTRLELSEKIAQLTAERAAHEETKQELNRMIGRSAFKAGYSYAEKELKQQLTAERAAHEEQEPYLYMRELDGEPDWGEDCVSPDESCMDAYSDDDRYSARPLYTSPIIPPSTAELIEQARREENEACAKTCDEGLHQVRENGWIDAANERARCAAAIRARMK